jgi:hypothetical protein
MANGRVTVVKRGTSTAVGAERVYVGRGSPLGNPYPMQDQSPHERTRVCIACEEHMRLEINNNNRLIVNELERILNIVKSGTDVELECFCAPLQCHGDYLKQCIEFNL